MQSFFVLNCVPAFALHFGQNPVGVARILSRRLLKLPCPAQTLWHRTAVKIQPCKTTEITAGVNFFACPATCDYANNVFNRAVAAVAANQRNFTVTLRHRIAVGNCGWSDIDISNNRTDARTSIDHAFKTTICYCGTIRSSPNNSADVLFSADRTSVITICDCAAAISPPRYSADIT